MITLIKDRIYIFTDNDVKLCNPNNEYSIGRCTGYVLRGRHTLELVDPIKLDFEGHNFEGIMGWLPDRGFETKEEARALNSEATYSKRFWKMTESNEIILEVDTTKYDVYKIAAVLNSGDLDGIRYYIETIKNSEDNG